MTKKKKQSFSSLILLLLVLPIYTHSPRRIVLFRIAASRCRCRRPPFLSIRIGSTSSRRQESSLPSINAITVVVVVAFFFEKMRKARKNDELCWSPRPSPLPLLLWRWHTTAWPQHK
ncbi:uncharacterized protein CELE_T04C9.2 [Caenorhabditis elegans]|uniref:Secreted protein n=1 Tax=Caenorhabditis elegans TaxID=6239 RepID=Q9GP91_CAEEL|nr:Secreted protein [Caenorhabditis elegans]CCD69975.1 Secreted protein [Caenorhabditis elegans]|eukprot:NP_498305.1 Uncharacterized protein CELE_T04C9.2 [Caenorhabditis elegans]